MFRNSLRFLAFALTLACTLNAATPDASSPVVPDVLRMRSGEPVRDAQMWWKSRRPEILKLFQTQVYGRMPAGKAAARITPRFKVDSVDRNALEGKAVRKQITISFVGAKPAVGKDGPRLHLLLYVPANAKGPVPVFLGLNFDGNHTVDADPGIQLPEVWVSDPAVKSGSKETVSHIRVRASEETRGLAASKWQVEKVIQHGYALATIYAGDIEPDFNGGMKYGVRQMFVNRRPPKVPGETWGALGAWAWGLSRALDYLERDSDIEPRAIAVTGFSRMGKAGVWAGARDQRFAMVVSFESGQGGIGLSHRKAGERLEHLNNAFPHWFAGNYRQYIGREEDLPVDGHMLLSLVAPRPAYVASAEGDFSSDPQGELLSAKEVQRVYRLLRNAPPKPILPNEPNIGFHVRPGRHDVTAFDWDRVIEFADKHFAK